MSADAAVAPDATEAPSPGAAPPVVPTAALVPFQRATLPEKITYAQELARAGLLPEAFRHRPANVLFAIEYGAMLRLAPMAAITGIHVIEGKPTASAALMSALVRREGHKLRIRFDRATMTATATLIRFDDPGAPFVSTWDFDRAVQARLVEIKNGKPWARDKKGRPLSWEKYPENMLKWRAIAEVCRDGAEECLMGVHYTPEELGAEVDEDGRVIIAGEVVAEGEAVSPITQEPEWAVEIPAAEDHLNHTRLTELWNLGRLYQPGNAELRMAIEDAGKRVKAELERRAAEKAAREADPDGAVVAEIVSEPHTPMTEEQKEAAADALQRMLRAEAAAAAAVLLDAATLAEVQSACEDITDEVALIDVLDTLTPEDREVLAISPDVEELKLYTLSDTVAEYTQKHRRAVREPLDDDS